MAHDFFIGDAIAVGRGYETNSQPVRTNRFGERPLDTNLIGALEKNLTGSVAIPATVCRGRPVEGGGRAMSEFKGRHFEGEIVLWAVRWYCRY
jgi:hypothetical protein